MLEVNAIDTYRGPAHILSGVSLRVDKEEVVCLVGRNGAGKTTTLKRICRLMLPTAGRITVNKIDAERKPEQAQQTEQVRDRKAKQMRMRP